MAIRETYTYDDFKGVLSVYNKLLSLSRSVAAGYDSSNVDHQAEEEALAREEKLIEKQLWEELFKIDIKGFWALEEALYKMGITRYTIFQCQETHILDENGYLIENKNYAKKIGCGFTFDDCYCLKHLLKTHSMEWPPFDNEYNKYQERRKAIQEQCSNYGKLVESLNKTLSFADKISDIRGYSDQKLIDRFEKALFEHLNKKLNKEAA